MRLIPVATASFALALALALDATNARADSPPPDDLTLDLGHGATLKARRVPATTFAQGSPPSDEQRDEDEAVRSVQITREFYVARTPTTREQFAAFVAATGYRTDAEKGKSGGSGWNGRELVQAKSYDWHSPGFAQADDHPVVIVTLADAEAFATWASTKTSRTIRLPTEAEYELATRARTTTRWYSGDKKEHALAIGWFKSNAGNATHPVAQKPPNAFGLFDMSGNVYEWCRDIYAPYQLAGTAAVVDPLATTPLAGEPARQVLRGGSWLRDPKRGRSAARYRSTAGTRSAEIGFRVVIETPPTDATAAPIATDRIVEPIVPSTNAPSSSGDGPPFALFAAIGGVVVALVGVLALLVKRGRTTVRTPALRDRGPYRAPAGQPAPLVSAPPGVTVTFGPDGFFVQSSLRPPGTSFPYDAIVDGRPTNGVVVIVDGPSGTFVYTGTTPTEVRIDGVGASGPRSDPEPTPTPRNDVPFLVGSSSITNDDPLSSSSSSSSSSSDFMGFPPAY